MAINHILLHPIHYLMIVLSLIFISSCEGQETYQKTIERNNLQNQGQLHQLFQDPKLPYHTMEVFGNASLGYYYTNLYFGSPPQRQSVIIDTGSGTLTVPCNKCKSCGEKHIDPYFDLTKSKTNKFLTCASKNHVCSSRCQGDVSGTEVCDFSISYAEGSSLNGIYLQDYVQLQRDSVGEQVKIEFGCTTTQTNLFLKQEANGIFGLSPERTQILEKMFNQHATKTSEKMEVSICLRADGGYMSIGGSEKIFHRKDPIKTHFTTGRDLYSLTGVGDVKIGEKVFHEANESPGIYGIFIDSGSTYTYLPRKQYGVLLAQLDKQCTQNPLCHTVNGQSMRCYNLDKQEDKPHSQVQLQDLISKIFQPIEFLINHQKLKWIPTEYFLLRDLNNREICSGISSLDRFLLGANWMVNKDITFNIKDRTIEIYPQSVCSLDKTFSMKQENLFPQKPPVQQIAQGKESKMGTVFPTIIGNPPLKKLDTQIKFQISSQILLIVLGVIFLVGALTIFYCFICKRQPIMQQLSTSQDDQERLSRRSNTIVIASETEMHIEEDHSNSNGQEPLNVGKGRNSVGIDNQ